MSESHNPAALLSVRLHRLFDTFHMRKAPAQSDAVVADSVTTSLGKPVHASEIRRLRSGEFDNPAQADPALLTAIAAYFGVPAVYLTEPGSERAETIDANLQVIAAARDAGVNGLALRGDSVDPGELTEIFHRIAARRKPVDGQDITT
ncbi:hypothetical protein AB0M12_38745 [Nocardia vinacea]|uniref:hypothetical protein n=1 Tax=Nocardia vinacea TaxID=96468 RepID=UPI003433BA54